VVNFLWSISLGGFALFDIFVSLAWNSHGNTLSRSWGCRRLGDGVLGVQRQRGLRSVAERRDWSMRHSRLKPVHFICVSAKLLPRVGTATVTIGHDSLRIAFAYGPARRRAPLSYRRKLSGSVADTSGYSSSDEPPIVGVGDRWNGAVARNMRLDR
jgi:hypothetical protein